MMGARVQEIAVLFITVAALSIIVRNAGGFATAINAVGTSFRLALREVVSPISR